MFVLGIDPGLEGAIALLSHGGDELEIYDMPVHEVVRGKRRKKEVDLHSLSEILKSLREKTKHAFIERVGAMTNQGVTSMFSFGETNGALRMGLVCHGFDITRVEPREWRKRWQVRKGKDGSRVRASELLPEHVQKWNLVKHHNRADAVLIGMWGLSQLPKHEPRVRRRLRVGKEGNEANNGSG